ncbi:hypothetical protein Tco_0519066 [Tanacetum coccineum]
MKKPTENPKSRTNNGCTGPRGEDYQKQADEEENFKEFDSLIAYVLETSLPQPQTQLDSTRPAGTCSGSPSSLKKNVFILDHVGQWVAPLTNVTAFGALELVFGRHRQLSKKGKT